MSGHEAATGPVTARIARDRAACTPADLDAVRFEVARVDVLAQVTLEHFDRTVWREYRRRPDRLRGAPGRGD
jgi:hypothetical protein